jgi:hypothetical protein
MGRAVGMGCETSYLYSSGAFHDPGDFLYQVAEIEGVIRLKISALFVT